MPTSVTFPDFAVRAAKLRSLTKTVVLLQCHLVVDENRQAWENYTVDHDSWVDEALDVQREDPNFQGIQVEQWNANKFLYGITGYRKGPGPYMVNWQGSPLVPFYPPYNYDGLEPFSVRCWFPLVSKA